MFNFFKIKPTDDTLLPQDDLSLANKSWRTFVWSIIAILAITLALLSVLFASAYDYVCWTANVEANRKELREQELFNADLRAVNQSLQSESIQLKSERDLSTTNLAASQKMLEGSTNQRDALAKSVEINKNELASLRSSIAALSREESALKGANDQFVKESKEREDQIEQTKVSLLALQEKEASLKTAIQLIAEKKSETDAQLSQLKTAVAELRTQQEAQNEDLAKRAALAKECEMLQAQLDDKREEMLRVRDDLTRETANLSELVLNLQTQQNLLKSGQVESEQVAASKIELAQLRKKLANFTPKQAQHAELTAELTLLLKQKDETSVVLVDLETQTADLMKQRGALTGELASLQEQYESRKQAVAGIDELEKRKANLTRETQSLLAQVEKINAQKSDIERLKGDKLELDSEIAALRKQKQGLVGEVKELKPEESNKTQ